MDGKMEIRRATGADAEAAAKIYNEFVLKSTATFEVEPISPEEMDRRLMDALGSWVAVAHENDQGENASETVSKEITKPSTRDGGGGRVVAFAYVHPWKERAAFAGTLETSIYVAPEAAGRGLGRRFAEIMIEYARTRGYRTLIACITAENAISCALHEKLGYRKASHFEKVGYKFGRWLDVVDYQLMLY